MDHLLDVVISADRSDWHWKDDDEFEQAVAIGVYTPNEAQAIRSEGERVIKIFQNNQSPFCDGWERWSPPATWGIPELPAGWDILFAD
jgi:predicted RNA-binding protein associated with RNAse of E/G family